VTPTTDTAGHPDITEISDLTEGLLSASRASELLRHLDECVSCADVHASLEEIRSLLGTLPNPQRMPDDIADRIDTALIAESGADSDNGDNKGSDNNSSISGHDAHVSRETSGADRPAGSARTPSAGPGRKARLRRGRRRLVVLSTAFTVAALGVASVVLASLNDSKKLDTATRGRSTASADTFSEATLDDRVTTLLDQAPKVEGTTHAPHSLGTDSGPGADDPKVLKSGPTVTVPSCIRQGIGATGTPLAADEGTYDGKDVYLVLLPDPSGNSTKVTAYIVDASCVSRPSIPAQVLLSHSYTRP
jgi:hypothetical protein